MTTKLALAIAILVAACGNGDKDAGGTGGIAGVTKPAAGDPAKPVAGARPAAITSEMGDAFEAYVVAFEKLMADLEGAGINCKAGIDVLERHGHDLAALAPRGEKLREGMKAHQGDREAAEWFATTYAPRIKAAATRMKTVALACVTDAKFKLAIGAAMAQFPMMKKKGT